MGAASEMMRFELQKKGKLPAAQRYKRIVAKKLEENKKKAMGDAYKAPSTLSSKITNLRKMSERTEQALKEIAARKAKKLAKQERQMVIVQPRNFHNGRITAKGEIYDIAGNIVAKVNIKKGTIASMTGWGIGKYRPKSMWTNVLIQEAINKYSPYFINLRRQQMLQQMQGQQFGVHGELPIDTATVFGPGPQDPRMAMNNPYGYTPEEQVAFTSYGADVAGPRQNIGVTAWGARSDNVHGTFADNAWGTSSDNVWGTNTTDVWGGVGAGNLWGNKGVRVWGTGNGVNYLKGITNFLAGLFGFTNKKNREALRQMNALAAAQRNSARAAASSGSTRSGAPSAPTRTR